jgi:hypothetical protein
MLPDFVIGGVMKSGTTFLHNLLINHPKIKILSRSMDYAYFDDDRVYKRGKEWYQSLFNDFSDVKHQYVIGQTSADCAFNRGSIERIIKYNPETKLIFVLRHPIDRAYSLYWHQYGMAREKYSFEKAVKTEKERIAKTYYNFKMFSYIERSRYKKQFEIVKSLVPEKNVLLLDFNSLVKDTKNTLNIILDFLQVQNINNLRELKYAEIPRNPALVPTNHFVVVLSYYIQRMGIESGRRLVNMFREETQPPKMDSTLYRRLEIELQDDINFYNEVENNFQQKIKAKNDCEN